MYTSNFLLITMSNFQAVNCVHKFHWGVCLLLFLNNHFLKNLKFSVQDYFYKNSVSCLVLMKCFPVSVKNCVSIIYHLVIISHFLYVYTPFCFCYIYILYWNNITFCCTVQHWYLGPKRKKLITRTSKGENGVHGTENRFKLVFGCNVGSEQKHKWYA